MDGCVGICEEINAALAVSFGVSEERIFASTEGEKCHGCGNTDVDSDHTRVDVVAKITGMSNRVSKKSRSVCKGKAVDPLDRFVQSVHFTKKDDGSENFRLCNLHLWTDVGKNGWIQEVT